MPDGTYGKIYGGYINRSTTDPVVQNNTLTLTSKHAADEIWGGYAEGKGSAVVSNNTVNFAGGTCSGSLGGGYAADYKGSSTSVNENSVTLTDVKFTGEESNIYGGYAYALVGGNATADKNSVTLTDVTFTGTSTVYGGYVILRDADAESAISASSSGNVLTITNGTYDTVYGGCAYVPVAPSASSAEASGNMLNLTSGTYAELYGAYAYLSEGTAKANYNGQGVNKDKTSTLSNVTAEYFCGAVAAVDTGSAEATGNKYAVEGGKYGEIVGGMALVLSGVKTDTATASDNVISMYGVETTERVFGGDATGYESGQATSTGNRLDIYGGNYQSSIYAGRSLIMGDEGTASSSGNTVALYSYEGEGPQFDTANTIIYGGYAKVGEKEQASSGNTLEFHEVQGLAAANIKNFDNLAFVLPDMKAGQTVLALEGGEETNIDGAHVSVEVSNLSEIDSLVGSRITLVSNEAGLSAEKFTTDPITYTKGATLYWDDFQVLTDDENNSLYLTRTGEDAKVAPGTKAIAEGAAAGLALVNESANTAIDFARSFSLAPATVTPFMHVQGSSATHETGSNVNLSSLSLLAGLGTGIDTGAGKLSAGAFFEYGTGSYTTSNTFDNAPDVDGDGNSWYMGGGILAKMEFLQTGPGHFYAEGSAHMGSLHNEYDTSDLRDRFGRSAGFDMDSPYYSLHGGIGYVWNITEEHDLDVYGKYIWTRVQGSDETLTTGDKFEFDDMDSSRVRFGARYSYNGSERFKPYVGVAYEHEFAGSCDSRTFGHAVAAPSFEGDTGIGELGLVMKPAESLPLSVNLGVQGYVGQKRGISGNCAISYEF